MHIDTTNHPTVADFFGYLGDFCGVFSSFRRRYQLDEHCFSVRVLLGDSVSDRPQAETRRLVPKACFAEIEMLWHLMQYYDLHAKQRWS
jgi:hypothetical protein